MPNHNEVWTLKKYLLYDFARDQLASSYFVRQLRGCCQAAKGHSNVMIVPLVIEQAEAPAGSQSDAQPVACFSLVPD